MVKPRAVKYGDKPQDRTRGMFSQSRVPATVKDTNGALSIGLRSELQQSTLSSATKEGTSNPNSGVK